MLLINWLELQPLLADLDALNERLQETLPIRRVCQLLAEITLHGYPWSGRSDLIPCYHPSRTYKSGQWIALPVMDPEERHPTVWQVAQVRSAEMTGNPVQGRFQALTLDVQGEEIRRAGGIPDASCSQPEIDSFTSYELGWLGEWAAETYAGPLLGTLRKLIEKGRVCGQIAGDTYLPEQMFTLPLERLQPFFARLSPAQRWLSLEEILHGLADLAHLRRETAFALLRATLKASPYRSLGGDRWTTPDLFEQLDREVPRGLPGLHRSDRGAIWTRQDLRDFTNYREASMVTQAFEIVEETNIKEGVSQPVRLPAMSCHHMTQAYFPVQEVLAVFPLETRMVFVQFLEGDFLPFLLDRENGLLKAVQAESLRSKILEAGLPAGTYLWLERAGNEKYRIFPHPLSAKQMVPGKLAHLEHGELRIRHIQLQLKYESGPYVFKADLSSTEVEALFAEARRLHLSLRDALVEMIQKLCAADPEERAQRTDILNAVFLRRACSPESISILLENEPCFERLEGDAFHYRPVPDRKAIRIRRQVNLARLWEDLLTDDVPPEPRVGEALPCKEPGEETAPWRQEQPAPINLILAEPETPPYDRWEERAGPAAEMEESLDPKVSPGFPLETSGALKPASLESLEGPGSLIDTRRMAYGLKIPARPLHKRPMYQRLLFCLRGWLAMSFGSSHDHAHR